MYYAGMFTWATRIGFAAAGLLLFGGAVGALFSGPEHPFLRDLGAGIVGIAILLGVVAFVALGLGVRHSHRSRAEGVEPSQLSYRWPKRTTIGVGLVGLAVILFVLSIPMPRGDWFGDGRCGAYRDSGQSLQVSPSGERISVPVTVVDEGIQGFPPARVCAVYTGLAPASDLRRVSEDRSPSPDAYVAVLVLMLLPTLVTGGLYVLTRVSASSTGPVTSGP